MATVIQVPRTRLYTGNPTRTRTPIQYAWHPPRQGRGTGTANQFRPPPPSGLKVRGTPTTIIGIAKTRGKNFPTARVVPARSPGS